MERKHLLTCDEMPSKPLKKLDEIKRIISSEPVLIEGKGVNAKMYTPVAKIVFAANNMPVLGEPDIGGGFAERLLIIPFVARQNDTDPNLLEKLLTDRDDFLSMAVKTMPDFIQRGLRFSHTHSGEQILHEFKENAFSLESFLKECCIKSAGSKLALAEFYDNYLDYCNNNMSNAIRKAELRAALSQMGYEFHRTRLKGYRNAVQSILGLAYRHDNIENNESNIISAKPAVVFPTKANDRDA